MPFLLVTTKLFADFPSFAVALSPWQKSKKVNRMGNGQFTHVEYSFKDTIMKI